MLAPVIAVVAAAVLGGFDERAAAAPVCAGVTNGVAQSAPAPGKPCWVEVTPYPFGDDGEPVVNPPDRCFQATSTGSPSPCFLVATSFAFRAWNRGVAAVRAPNLDGRTAFGVWVYNGVRWFPDPTYPSASCSGDKVLWAGKLDYWLVGGTSLCRFDGDTQAWQVVRVPSATTLRLTYRQAGRPIVLGLDINDGVCAAWDSCWFFGKLGTVLRWNGVALQDASPDPAPIIEVGGQVATRPLLTDFRAARIQRSPEGRLRAVAVGGTGDGLPDNPVKAGPFPGGAPPPQLWTLDTAAMWNGQAWTPPSLPRPNDPFRTDLVAVDLDSEGRGWVAGRPRAPLDIRLESAGPSPLVPITSDGPDPACEGPSVARFGNGSAGAADQDRFAWSSISNVPGTRDVLAGGLIRPFSDPAPRSRNQDSSPEVVVAKATCAGQVDVTRFSLPDPTEQDPKPLVAATRAPSRDDVPVVATAPNVAWAATPTGFLSEAPPSTTSRSQIPRLYRFTDTLPPQAAPGDDNETRLAVLQEDLPVFVFEPPPADDPLPPPRARPKKARPLPAAIYAIKTTVVNSTLEVTFKVRRRTMIGVSAERNGVVVATTGLKVFTPGNGQLSLKLDPKRWPTKIVFIDDLPKVTFKDPGRRVRRTITLRASATPIAGRTIAKVRFEVSRAGREEWDEIGTDATPPFTARFDTTTLRNGRYDFRVVAYDNTDQTGISANLKPTLILNGRQ